MAELHDTTEQYLETVLGLEEEGITPLRARLVERLGVSAPSVSQTVSRLEEDGYLVVGDDRVITLTSAGRELATGVVRKHRLAERLLRDVIGLEWSKIHHEACRWEHAISDEVEQKLVELLDDPGTCPHGNPIPGSTNLPDQSRAVPLTEAPEGPISVVRISEQLETDDEAMLLMEGAGFVPGRDAEVKGHDPDGVRVIGAVADALLPPHVAELTYVVPR
ncbi:MAG: metal-dependent transcriptional regulator [Actinobacteria bacterium]|nr:metal-dependent transcriptional regulator [Actinomycetota bacterium]